MITRQQRHLEILLLESLHYSRPMLGAGSSSGVELFQVFMGTRLWQARADQQVFHCLFIPTFARCLSLTILVASPFLHTRFASSGGDSGLTGTWRRNNVFLPVNFLTGLYFNQLDAKSKDLYRHKIFFTGTWKLTLD